METKKCSKCGEVKALGEFDKCSSARGGWVARCKECKNAANRNRRKAENPGGLTTKERDRIALSVSGLKLCTRCGETKSFAEFNKDKHQKDGFSCRCRACKCLEKRNAHADNPDANNRRSAEYRAKFPEKCAATKKRWYSCHAPEVSEKRRARYATDEEFRERVLRDMKAYGAQPGNKERTDSRRREYVAEFRDMLNARRTAAVRLNPIPNRRRARAWAKSNPHRTREHSANRRAQKLNATPGWANRAAMRRVYAKAKEWASVTGERWDVDHIVPLIHPLVCGLHCEANLQLLVQAENASKGNRYWPDMP